MTPRRPLRYPREGCTLSDHVAKTESTDYWPGRARMKVRAACVRVWLRSPRLAGSLYVCAISNVTCSTMVRRAARDLSPLPHFPSAKMHGGRGALGRSTRRRPPRRHHRTSLEKEVVDAHNSKAKSRQAQAATRRASPWLSRVASKPWLKLWRTRRRLAASRHSTEEP